MADITYLHCPLCDQTVRCACGYCTPYGSEVRQNISRLTADELSLIGINAHLKFEHNIQSILADTHEIASLPDLVVKAAMQLTFEDDS